MASKLKTNCRFPGCPRISNEPFCDDHKKQERKRKEQNRKSSSQRGYNARWRKARIIFLNKHPFCKHCQEEGRLTNATVVDHITPHKGDYELFWNESNWQPLCKQHHDIKTAKEDGGFGNG